MKFSELKVGDKFRLAPKLTKCKGSRVAYEDENGNDLEIGLIAITPLQTNFIKTVAITVKHNDYDKLYNVAVLDGNLNYVIKNDGFYNVFYKEMWFINDEEDVFKLVP